MYVPLIIQYLQEQLKSEDICAKLGLCEQQKLVQPRNNVNIPEFKNFKDDPSACDICQDLVTLIDAYLDESATQEKIKTLLLTYVCPHLPDQYVAICQTVANTYIALVVKYLEQELSTLDVCKKVGLCTNQIKKVNTARKAISIPKGADNGFVCTLCTEVIRMVDDYLDDGKTEEEIISLITKYCDKIPAPYGAICDSLAAQYIPMVIKYLTEELTADEICTKIGLCKYEKKSAPRNPKVVLEAAGVSCDICKDFVNWVEKELKEYTVPALWKLVSVDCMKVPHLSKFCSIITQNDIQTILNLILNKLPAQKVCEWIKLC